MMVHPTATLLAGLLLLAVPDASAFLPGVPGFHSTSTSNRALRQQTTGFASTDGGGVAEAKSTGTDARADTNLSQPAVPKEDSDRRLALMNDALCNFNSPSSAELLSELSTLRNSSTSNSQQMMEACLNDLLTNLDELPIWTKLRGPLLLPRFSKRARLAALRRTLDFATPPPSVEDPDVVDDEAEQQRRRRRAFVTILRSLSASDPDDDSSSNVAGPAIRYLEKKARRENRMMQKMCGEQGEDLTLRRPDDLETPEYTVVSKAKGNGVEIRRYEPFSVCSVSMTKPRPTDSYKTDATVSDPKTGGASGFGALAGYLFGKNRKNQAMKMTTPVLTNDLADGDRQMSFVLPSDYWKDVSTAPQPLKESGVTLRRIDGDERAVVMFGGYASKGNVQQRKEQLIAGLAKDDKWEAVPDDTIILSQYNDPFTAPWKRLNEVSVGVRPIASKV